MKKLIVVSTMVPLLLILFALPAYADSSGEDALNDTSPSGAIETVAETIDNVQGDDVSLSDTSTVAAIETDSEDIDDIRGDDVSPETTSESTVYASDPVTLPGGPIVNPTPEPWDLVAGDSTATATEDAQTPADSEGDVEEDEVGTSFSNYGTIQMSLS